MRGRITKVAIGNERESIGKDDLFQKTRKNKHNSALDYDRGGPPPKLDLRDKLPCPNDWTCDQMRKEGNEESVVDEVPDSLHVSPINIDRIREAGESVEADSNWKNDL